MAERVVIISPAYPYRGGQAMVETHWHNMLKKMGYDAYTITYKLLYPNILFPGKTQFDESGVIYYEHNNRIFRIINSVNPFTWYRAYKKIKELETKAIIIVWWMSFFGPCLGTICWLSKKVLNVRVIFLIENYISHESGLFSRLISRNILKLADDIIIQSRFIKDVIKKDCPHIPIHQVSLPIYDCFDENRFTKESARKELGIKSRNVVLYFGYIRQYKGLKNLLFAFNRILEKEPDTTLLIVGEYYDNKGDYNNIIEKEGYAKNVIIVDRYVSNEEVEVFFKASDLTCLPYNSATQSGIVMLSYAFKKPIVVTRVGGLPEFVIPEKTGIVIPPNDLTALSNAVLKIFDLRNIVNFEKNIQEFNDEIGYKKVKQVLQTILEFH